MKSDYRNLGNLWLSSKAWTSITLGGIDRIDSFAFAARRKPHPFKTLA
jgi:hypothetical protein